MGQERPGFAAEKRGDNDNRKLRPSEPTASVAPKPPKQATLGQRWSGLPVCRKRISSGPAWPLCS